MPNQTSLPLNLPPIQNNLPQIKYELVAFLNDTILPFRVKLVTLPDIDHCSWTLLRDLAWKEVNNTANVKILLKRVDLKDVGNYVFFDMANLKINFKDNSFLPLY